MTPAFHFKILEQFSDTFHNAGKILVAKLTEQNNKDIDIYPYIAMYAFDAICGKFRTMTKFSLVVTVFKSHWISNSFM